MASTLALDRTLWDLTLDVDGNIALATEPYSIAQDAASAIRTVQGEVYYNTALGIPYFQSIFGQSPPLQYLKNQFTSAALTVPDTLSAVCYLASLTNREVDGQVQITDISGTVSVVTTAPVGSPFILGQSILGGPDVLQ